MKLLLERYNENTAMIIYSYSIRASGRISVAFPWDQREKLIKNIAINLIDSTLNSLNQSLLVSVLISLEQWREGMLLSSTIYLLCLTFLSINWIKYLIIKFLYDTEIQDIKIKKYSKIITKPEKFGWNQQDKV